VVPVNLLRWVLALSIGLFLVPAARAQQEVRVTVVTILASPNPGGKLDPKLEKIAPQLQKKEKSLKSFRLAVTTSKPVAVGKRESFELVEDQKVIVEVNHGADKDNKVSLTITPPEVKRITYRCCCGKFLPLITPYRTKNKDWLIVAVMVEPCP
jgi:hypothetical protein